MASILLVCTLYTLLEERRNFLERNYSHSLTGNPYSGISLDMITEIDKGSKLNILKIKMQILVHSRNCKNIDRIRTAVNDQINKKQGTYRHPEATFSDKKVTS